MAEPRYFFHQVGSAGVVTDTEGVLLPDLEAARRLAVKGARGLMCEDLQNGFIDLDQRIDIRDEEGTLVATIAFRDTVQLRG